MYVGVHMSDRFTVHYEGLAGKNVRVTPNGYTGQADELAT